MKWYKRDPDAALVGMIGLTPEERGIYNTLIDLLYSRNGNVPNDDAFMARACECDPRMWRRVRDRLIAKGKVRVNSDGTLDANRVKLELSEARSFSEMQRSGAEVPPKISKNINENNEVSAPTRARAQPTTTTTTTIDSVLRKTESGAVSKNRTGYSEAFEVFWKAYPKRDGANPKQPACKAFLAALKAGATAEEIIAGAERYRKDPSTKVGTPFVTMAVTWLHQKRWTDYPETNPEAKSGNGGGFYAKPESPQLEAWDAHRKATTGKSAPRDAAGGWHFPTEWPPGYAAAKLKAELMAGLE